MPSFNEHIFQAKKNFQLLGEIDENIQNCEDWKVTIAFYTALHLVSAHLAQLNSPKSSHTAVEHAINPNIDSPTKIDEQIFIDYTSLYQLSRRARYLIQDASSMSAPVVLMNEKHFAKALNKLERIIKYFNTKHTLNFPTINVNCVQYAQKSDTKHILKKQNVSAK